MWARDLSGIRFTGERERIISGAVVLAVNDWAERTHTKRNIEPLRFVHMLWLHLVLLDLITHIYLPYVCSRDMLQLFGKGLIGFLWK